MTAAALKTNGDATHMVTSAGGCHVGMGGAHLQPQVMADNRGARPFAQLKRVTSRQWRNQLPRLSRRPPGNDQRPHGTAGRRSGCGDCHTGAAAVDQRSLPSCLISSRCSAGCHVLSRASMRNTDIIVCDVDICGLTHGDICFGIELGPCCVLDDVSGSAADTSAIRQTCIAIVPLLRNQHEHEPGNAGNHSQRLSHQLNCFLRALG